MTTSEKLLWLCAELGKEARQLVVLQEGCASARSTPGRILTKAGEAQLGSMTPADVVECEEGPLQGMFETPLLDANHRVLREVRVDQSGRVPGPDAMLHSWLLRLDEVNFVAQVHPVACLQVLCSQAGERFADHRMFPEEVFAFGAQAVYVPYTDPGVPMAREIRSKMTINLRRNHGLTPPVILVQNFGVYALGPTAESVLRVVLTLEKAAQVFVGASRLGGPVFLPPQQIVRLEMRAGDGQRPSLIKL